MIGVINYGAGNLGSVMNALEKLAAPARFARDADDLRNFDSIIFPGDGHFATAMSALEQSGYAAAIKDWIQADKPFLGICIGLQLLFEESDEAPGAAGLSVLDGAVRRFPGRKVPQIGWNNTSFRAGSRLFQGLPDNSFFYYIHSYYAAPSDASVCAATAEYYVPFCGAVERGALCATQFHPEKSGAAGLRVLENWIRVFQKC
jgi:imidazole glycerol phosphate synthase glutamine amidotransferase subunit